MSPAERVEYANKKIASGEWTQQEGMTFARGGGKPGGAAGGNAPDQDYYEDMYREMVGTYPGQPTKYVDDEGVSWVGPSSVQVPEAEFYGEDPMDALEFEMLGPSAMEGVKANPIAMGAQLRALQGYQDIYDQGGLTAIDRDRIAQTRALEDQYLRGEREATMANMNARGMGGSGMELLSQLQSQQASGMRHAAADSNMEALAQARRDAALDSLFGAGTDIRTQQWDEDAARAEAKDAINRMNNSIANRGREMGWTSERDRKMREAERRTAYSDRRHEEPFRRHLEKFGMVGGASAADQGYRNTNTARINARTAQDANDTTFWEDLVDTAQKVF